MSWKKVVIFMTVSILVGINVRSSNYFSVNSLFV